MSWKSLVSAGLLCVLASPAFALPQLEVTFGGINAAGNFVWNVRVAPTAAGTPMDAELAFSETSAKSIVKVTNSGSAIWDTNNPGVAPASFTWVVNSGTPAKPEGLQGNFTGAADGTTVVNAAVLGGDATSAVNAALDQIYAALGSKDLLVGDLSSPAGTTIAASTPLLQIEVSRPIAGASQSDLALLGGYDSNTSGHISEITSGTNSSNYKGFSGTATRKIIAGDADLSNGVVGTTPAVTGSDLVILAQNIGPATGKIWTQGDFDGNGQVTGADLVIIAQNIGLSDAAHIGSTVSITKTGVLDSPGSGLGSGGAVPEPASIALIGLAVLGGLGLRGRNR
jgi:hypothetical protein